MMHRYLIVALSLFAGSFQLVFSQPTSPSTAPADRMAKITAALPVIEKLYSDYAAQRNVPGLGFGVVVDGKLIYGKGIGFADLETKRPATAQSQFRIASMTKSLTAMAILKLRDEGKLRLDDPAANYVPELKQLKPLTTDAPAITIRHLLTHAAGFPEDNPWGDRQLADSEAEFTQFLKGGVSLSNAPGVAYEYANLGFALLGRIITNVTKQPYQQYITNAILKPLGMTSTIWDYRKADPARYVNGYRWQEGKYLPEVPLADGSWGAMGGLITTVDDFANYMALHLSAWPARDGAETGPVKRSSIREMQQPWNFRGLNPQFKYASRRLCPQTISYAYGLVWVRDCEGRVSVGHSGGLPGFGSEWQVLPDYGIGVIGCANLTYSGLRGINTIALDTLISLAGLKPRPLAVSPILAKRKAELVSLLPDWKNGEASGIFAENFFPDTPIALRRKYTQALFDKIGKVVRVGELAPENSLRGTFRMDGERGSLNVFFTLTPEANPLIQQLDITEVKL
ncbi:serine hydrolase domain-containing protein [Fibrella forsythiae]|uniref:Beta-lactamase family protein n=1 Tax=Fibrella forsythiae TaxID=2817061 RepID=A0ABS3JBT1_9BACT|nr:serine hydrolase domain-containing protein [Fibrella forsythiae]MBO0947456.1 beta-lactamase family protein [Fibrella forsythiae]